MPQSIFNYRSDYVTKLLKKNFKRFSLEQIVINDITGMQTEKSR